jgi:hypothetical protein
MGFESGFARRDCEAMVYPASKRAYGKITRIMIQQGSTDTSRVVAFPSGHEDMRLEIRARRQGDRVQIEFPLWNRYKRHDFSRLSQGLKGWDF